LLSGATANLRVSSPARTTVKDAVRAWRVAPPTLAAVQAERSRSIAARLVVADQRAMSLSRAGTVVAVSEPPPTAVAHAAPTLVQRTGAAGAEHLAAFSSGLLTPTSRARAAAPPRGTAGATLSPGQIVVLKMPNARADTAMSGDRPRLGVSGAPARVVVLGHGGVVAADRNIGDGGTIEIAQGAERIVAVGQGSQTDAHAGLVGWHSGMQMAYAGWSTGIAPGCVVRSAGEPLRLHRERVDAGWVTGAELARGVSTVTTTFSTAPSTVVVVLDDPAAFGDSVDGRTLLLGLDGAHRALDAARRERPPVLLVAENRSILAYDVVPDGDRPVVVTIASQAGWSLVGVMGSSQIDATGAIALVSARGLDSAIHPFASATAGAGDLSRLSWIGPTRTPEERRIAQMRASARPPMSEPAAPPAQPGRKPPKRGGKRAKAVAKPHKTAAKTSKPAAKHRKSAAGKTRAKGRSKGRR
jgi:large repetitive protein